VALELSSHPLVSKFSKYALVSVLIVVITSAQGVPNSASNPKSSFKLLKR